VLREVLDTLLLMRAHIPGSSLSRCKVAKADYMPKYFSEPNSAMLAPRPHLSVVSRLLVLQGDSFLSRGHGRGLEAT